SEPKHFLTAYFVQLFDYQGVFRFVCAGSGANYRQFQRGVNTFFIKLSYRSEIALKAKGRALRPAPCA
ncbi:hypothetical protein BWR59_15205, partial [Pseudomonas sp. Bc-h]